MAKKYIKHDREVTPEQLNKYGKYATHDIHVPILLLYPAGKVTDKNGTDVKIDDDFIHRTMSATNASIKKKFESPFAKTKSFIASVIGDYEHIPIIKNHNTSDVDGTVGHSKGLCYLETIDNMKCLMILGVIKDPEAKMKIEGDIFRNTSLGTRPDGSIKEISIVSNEALPHGGFMMSEKDNIQQDDTIEIVPQINKETLLLHNELQELQLSEHQLTNITIPNHIILARMIKKGKIEAYKYDELINKDTSILELMEQSLPTNNLGIMFGTSKQLSKIDASDTVLSSIVKDYKKNKKDIKDKKTTETLSIEAIKLDHNNLKENRAKELKHIVELMEYSSSIAKDYINIELGEGVEVKGFRDKYLTEYLERSKELKNKINNLQIQLGEKQ